MFDWNIIFKILGTNTALIIIILAVLTQKINIIQSKWRTSKKTLTPITIGINVLICEIGNCAILFVLMDDFRERWSLKCRKFSVFQAFSGVSVISEPTLL